MNRIWHSVAFRLALTCGGMVVASIVLLSAVFYFGTVGVLARDINNKITALGQRFADGAERSGLQALANRIGQALNDGVDSDTEIYLLTDSAGRKVAGNISAWTDKAAPLDRVIDHPVVRDGRPTTGRVLLHRLSNGALLIVGRDMSDLNEIRAIIGRAIAIGGLLALVFAIGGTLLFRRQIEGRIWAIRHAALDIEGGNLSRRIPLSGEPDEFDRLSADINRMLDRIERLMEGVRHVSNTIAHNLRTPLGRIRGHLDQALRGKPEDKGPAAAENFAIDEIDGLIVVLDKLLQIAEAESSTRRQPFEPVALRDVVTNLVELYDAAAEAQAVTIVSDIPGELVILGDKDLLASILANLLDNALKYAGSPAKIEVRARQDADKIVLIVQDNGPGIPPEERSKVLQRFYRLDRRQQGHGLGLSIVDAFARLHGGMLFLEDAAPGLRVRIVFRRADAATLPNGNPLDRLRIGSTP
jgi:signal transduction histidine kinase